MLKVDTLDNNPISQNALNKLISSITTTNADTFVFSDFRHGIFNRDRARQLSNVLPAGSFSAADSQVSSRWGNILDFQGFDLITPNEREARFALGDQDSTIRPLALELYSKTKCKTLVMKLGEKGILTYRAPNPKVRSFFTIDSFADKVIDPVGAGDALLAYMTLALSRGCSSVTASILGTFAAAASCESEGNNPVDREDVLEKVESIEGLSQYS